MAYQAAEPPGTPSRRSRRSWFDAPPLTTLDPPTLERTDLKAKRRSNDSIETLILTHFTNPPRISFGKILVGKTKLRTLLLRNPHDYEQEVIVERFPFKKKFMVNQTRFTVAPEEIFSLEITWTPDEDGGFREMIQFHINECYRLQAFMFGTAEKPKPQRKMRRHQLAPRIKEPPTVVQTSALTSIQSSYSPRRSQEVLDMLEDLSRISKSENKENSQGVLTSESMKKENSRGVLASESMKRENSHGVLASESMNKENSRGVLTSESMNKENSQGVLTSESMKRENSRGVLVSESMKKENSLGVLASESMKKKNSRGVLTIESENKFLEQGSVITLSTQSCIEGKCLEEFVAKNKVSAEEEILKSPTPLESTTITSLQDKGQANQKNRRQWRNITGITSPTLNTMSPIPRTEGNDNGIIVDSYYQPNETGVDVSIKARPNEETDMPRQTKKLSGDLKKTFVVPMLPSEPESFTQIKRKKLDCAEDRTSHMTGSNLFITRDVPIPPQVCRTDETQCVQAKISCDEQKNRHTGVKMSPGNSLGVGNSSPASPRTMLNQSLSMISQMKFPRSSLGSPQDANQSMNCSLISLGQGAVSPNSFMEDMKSMRCESSRNTSTPLIPSPLSVLNNSIPHSVMVNHLKNIKSSLNSPVMALHQSESTRCVKDISKPAMKAAPMRRSITSQFNKQQLKKIAIAASAVTKDAQVLTRTTTMKEIHKKSSAGSRPLSTEMPSPRRGTFILKKAEMEARKLALAKKSPRKSPSLKRSLSKRLQKKSPKRCSPFKKSPKRSTQELAMKRVKSKVGKENIFSLESCPFPIVDPRSDDVPTGVNVQGTDGVEVYKGDNTTEGEDTGVETLGLSTPVKDNESLRYFDDLLAGEGNSSLRNVSVTRQGKLFPDIQVPDLCDGQTVDTEVDVDCVAQADVKPQVDPENLLTAHPPRSTCLQRVVMAAEKSMSPQKFLPVSPSTLPTSPGQGFELSRRGTLTVTKSRPSDALLTAMSNRKKLFSASPLKAAGYSMDEDGTVTKEDIRVRVEEHYEEVDGKMYVVVKEITDVVKSTTETYMEQLGVSPKHFQTPGRLPSSPDPYQSRRSTHVVRSPKVLNKNEVDKRRLFVSEESQSNNEIPEEKDPSLTEESKPADSSSIKSDTFDKEPTILLSPAEVKFVSFKGDQAPITSVCVMSPRLVEYDVASEEGSADVTRDSLETTQSSDSLNKSTTCDAVTDKVESRIVSDSKNAELKNSMSQSSVMTVSEYYSTANSPECSHDENSVLDHCNVSQQLVWPADQRSKTGDDHRSEAGDDHRSDADSGDDVYYDTLSETYFENLNDRKDAKLISDEAEIINEANLKSTSEITSCTSELKLQSATGSATGEDKTMSVHCEVSPHSLNEISSTNLSPVRCQNDEQCSHNEDNIKAENCIDRLECFVVMETEMLEFQKPQPEEITTGDFVTNRTKQELITTGDLVNLSDRTTGDLVNLTGRTMGDLVNLSDRTTVDLVNLTDRSTQELVNLTDRKKLRRSVSADTILPAAAQVSDLQKSSRVKFGENMAGDKISARQPFSPSKFKKPTVGANKIDSRTAAVGRQKSLERPGPNLKMRSQSMTNLLSQTEKKKSPKKTVTESLVKKEPVKPASIVNKNLMKTKAPAKGVAQSRLILVKKPKTGAPRHPMPFAARNMYYDERWIEKQERGFIQWLNFVLTPPDEYVAVTCKQKVDAGSLSLENRQVAARLAPTKEILSFRSYAARRRLNRLRRSACELYQSDAMVNIICKIEVEVESRRLAARKDKMIHADLGIKQRLLDLLLHYSSLWLRIGLETVFGEVVMLQSNTDIVGLSRFIVTRLLASPDIAAEFAHPTVPHLYKEGYAAAVSRHTIKKFLLLVYFLDQAKSSRLIDHDPCLFCKDAEIKSSKEILIQFSREVLSGEGDLTRHLAYLGYMVNQTQKPIDEFDFAVKTLSADLRDGLRLSRVLELLAGNQSIMGKLRAPAISRLQKIHNMEAFFKAMCERSLDFSTIQSNPITPRDVVDGHREKTLMLLWHLIIHFQSSIQVNLEQLKEEIDLLLKSLQLKLAMQKVGVLSSEECQARRDSGDTKFLMDNERLQLIFQWCRLVCLHYGVKVENFTVSFSDGRALCCLIHHYHPALLPLSDIRFQTSVSFQEAAERQCEVEMDPDASMDWGHGGGLVPNENDPELFERLLTNEKTNFKTLYEKVSELGGVPLMLKSADMSNTIPDEKVVSTYTAYLCARLLDIREEVRAARIIQMVWRRRQLGRAIKKRQIRTKAAVTIQRWIRPFLAKKLLTEQAKAAVCIQAVWRSQLARRAANNLRQERLAAETLKKETRSAVVIQSLWRAHAARRLTAKLREEQQTKTLLDRQELAATVLQKHLRGLKCRQDFLRQRAAAVKIQSLWRRQLARRKVAMLKVELMKNSAVVIQKYMRRQICRNRFNKLRVAAVAIQKNWRMFHAKQQLRALREARLHCAATTIQKFVRRRLCERKYKEMKKACVTVQCCWRRKLARAELKRLRTERENRAAILIQSILKSWILARLFEKKKKAAVVVQKTWRRCLAERELVRLRRERTVRAAVVVQSVVRCVAQRQAFIRQKNAVVVLQKHWRKHQALKLFAQLQQARDNRAAVIVQSVVRAVRGRKMYLRKKSAATVLQKHWRRCLAQRQLRELQLERRAKSAVIVQSVLQAGIQRRKFLLKRSAVVVLQKHWRSVLAERELAGLKLSRHTQAVLVLQKVWRGRMMQRRFISLRKAAVVIQSFWRMLLAKTEMERLKLVRREQCAILIQKSFRAYKCQKEYHKYKSAVITLQNYWRVKQSKRKLKTLKLEKMERAAVKIQKHVRGMKARRQYLQVRASTVQIQRYWRQAQRERKLRQEKMLTAVVTLQKYSRGWRCRKRFSCLKKSALVLQSHWKMVQARRLMLVLQSQRQNKCAVLIQKTWKGFTCLKRFNKMKDAAITLQSCWRMYTQRQSYTRVREATLIIQSWHRANVLAKHCRSEFIGQRKAAVSIQSWWRSRYQRQEFFKTRQAVLVLQAGYRRFTCRQKYLAQQLEALTLQKRCENLAGKQLKQATILVQRRWREILGQRLEKRVAAAKVLQTAFRRVTARKKFLLKKKAALVIQTRLREVRLAKQIRQRFLQQKQAAKTIQSAYRVYRLKKEYLHVCHAVVKIQALVRCRLAVKKYKTMRSAAIVIQRHYRAFVLGQVFREAFVLIRKSSVVIQRFYRSVRSRRLAQQDIDLQNLAATKIQSIYRGWSQRQDFLLLRAATVCIQRRFRALQEGRCVRRDVERMKAAVCLIERSRLSLKQIREAKKVVADRRKEVEREIARQREAELLEIERKNKLRLIEELREAERIKREKCAFVLQRNMRNYLEKKRKKKRQAAATTIQKFVRSFLAQQKFKRSMQQVLLLQRLVKGFAYRRRFERMRLASRIIQVRWREILEGRKLRREFLTYQAAALKIQSLVRMKREREKFVRLLTAVTVIQSCVRRFIARKRFSSTRRCVVWVQRQVRQKQLMRRDRDRFLKVRQAVVKIQTVVRAWRKVRELTRDKSAVYVYTHWSVYQETVTNTQCCSQTLTSFMFTKHRKMENKVQHTAARIIQRAYRLYRHKQHQVEASAARVIQRTFQKFVANQKAKREFAALLVQKKLSSSAAIIQSVYRMYAARKRYLAFRHSVILLQSLVRGKKARQEVEEMRKKQKALTLVQAAVRGFLVRKKYSAELNERLNILHEERTRQKASVKLQALWRGYVARRDSKNKKLALTRRRLQEATRAATYEQTLGSRTSSALDYLLKEKDLAYILEALMHLEVSTRLSPVCCLKMVEVNAVSVLYRLINSCNRSVPHMELIKYAVNILLNLSKYDKTVEAVIEPEESIATILELLQIFREKGLIFFNSCMLLGILGLKEGCRVQIMQHPHIVERLQSVHALTLRKQRANQTRQVTKAKLAAMKSCNYTLPVMTPCKSKRRKIQPAWVLSRDNIKDFEDPLAAVTFVMDVLHIGPKM
ncbi:abnormal spindle-like microcephaly-associated protein homolog isoform X2 [Physella acuta]|uniref:abnormal spindle-like microcephaly-associated protein homolog isoform X2 n=1 Tax=Physella acuta TaxID=109671 RepID=UPI0027DD2D31|nr:abnormal spindle-like microcephaly-associated protein homolog isoform X2 [Physella acuta]